MHSKLIKLPDGQTVLDFSEVPMSAADADWIRAARLMKKAEAGDKDAQAELDRLRNTPAEFISVDEFEEME